MGINDQLSGGGRAGTTTGDEYALDKPYDLYGQPTSEMVTQLDEMLLLLFRNATANKNAITTLSNSIAGAIAAAIAAIPAVSTGISQLHEYMAYVVTGTTVGYTGWGAAVITGATDDGNSNPDSTYMLLLSAGVGLSSRNFLEIDVTRLSFTPIHFDAKVRTYGGGNQTEYRVWCGLQASTTAVQSDTLGLGISFRYHHPAPSGPDSGNWILCVNDGSVQTEVDTLVSVEGGAASHSYRLEIDVTDTITWTITKDNSALSTTGTTPIPVAFDQTARLTAGLVLTEITAGSKVFKVSYIKLTTR